MKQILEISKREFRNLFYSPVGWLVLIIFAIQLGSLLSGSLNSRSVRVWGSTEGMLSLTFNMLFTGGNSIIIGIIGNLFLYIPLLTMGLLSREFNEGTIKLLYSSPVDILEIVLGKYLAVSWFALLMVGIVGIFSTFLGLFIINNIDIQLVIWGLIMLYLLICTYAAIGLFISSLTNHQFVAAIGVVGVLFGLNYASTMTTDGMPEIVASILIWLQGVSFLYYFKGYIGSWDIIYFLLMISLFLTLTYFRLMSMRNNWPWWNLTTKYFVAVLLVVSLGYLTSRPQMKYYTDVRRAELTDTKILISREDVPKWRFILMQVVPGTMIVFATVIITRRRRK